LALEDILRALEDNAEDRIEAIKQDTQQRVNEIVSEVEKEASRSKRLRLKKVQDAIKSECTGIVYSASLKAKNELIKAQEETVYEAFRLAEQRLAGLHSNEEYPKIFELLLDECLEILDGEVVLRVRADDRGLLDKLMANRDVPYSISETPLEASGGLVAGSPDGEVIVYNSFESRLSKAKETLRLEISNALFNPEANS
jgi:vacuolar-type H+-ATPase subunit E/Vma4